MLQRVAEAEQEQEQRAFLERAEGCRAGRGDQHQRVDLEPLETQIVDGLAQREEPAEEIGCDEAHRGKPVRRAGNQIFDGDADAQQSATRQGEDQLCIGSEELAMRMIVAVAFRVLFALRPVVVTGMRLLAASRNGCRLPRSPDAEAAQCLVYGIFRCGLAIELDMDGARGVRFRFEDPLHNP